MIAQRLNVDPEDVREVEKAIESSDLSLDATIGDGESSVRYLDTLEATEEMIDENLARGELQDLFNQEIKKFSAELNDRQKTILYERLIAESPKTLQVIADQYAVTREAIRLTEKSLVAKIKEHMQEAFKNVTDYEFGLMG